VIFAAYDKLQNYGFRVHRAMDGASHYVLYAEVAANKTSETLYKPFAEAVRRFGNPLCVRSDFAAEHTLIRQHMLAACPGGPRNPFLVGSSIQNQV
jgi:hypothetical protein